MSSPDTLSLRRAVAFAVAAHVFLLATSIGDRCGGWSFYTPYSRVEVWSVVGQGFAFLAFGAWSAAVALGAVHLWRQRRQAFHGRSGRLVGALAVLLASYVGLVAWSVLQPVLGIGVF